jgi:L-ascorbate metabolism protein UlaG (beta-lactamase superfamily)
MEIEYKGGNSVIITTKKATVVVDPKLSKIGLKDIVVKDAIQLVTTEDQIVSAPQRLTITGPGEFEVADLSLKGIAAPRHIDTGDARKATMFTLDNGTTRVGVLGHVRADLSEQQLEDLGTLDILIVPVGGGGYTLDAVEATTLVRQIAPKVVIPVHYADAALKYEVPQGELALFIKDMGAAHEVVSKFKIKNGVLPETLTVVEITRTS